jgi:hypothetical protein
MSWAYLPNIIEECKETCDNWQQMYVEKKYLIFKEVFDI